MSNLIEKINADFMAAYKAKDMETKDFLGLMRGELTKNTKTPDDKEVISKCKSMLKKNDESMEKMKQMGIDVVSSLSEREIEILNSYIPAQMSEGEIEFKVKEAIDGGANNIGRIMGAFKGLEADMKFVKETAEKQLNLI